MNRGAGAPQAVMELVEAGGRTAQAFGFPRLMGQLYMLLYLSPEPRSLEDIAKALGVSKASVSIAARNLALWGAVRRVWIKGDRRDFYEAVVDVRAILNGGVLPAVTKKLESARLQIQRCLELVETDGGDPNTKRFLRDRLNLAEQRRRRVASLIDHPLLRQIL
ncbi:MAG: hypothetical protein NZ740_05130 [Kiritimatiellae bacterium]|nr:hypothetical protein [Kiritimatiellia bacterium]MDW8458476.1 hypothetical protein [Verrucomicrobiota bacterium]